MLFRDHVAHPLMEAVVGIGDVPLEHRYSDCLLAWEVLIKGSY